MPAWQRASEVPELTTSPAASLRSTIVGIPPPPASMVAVQAAYEQSDPPKSVGPASKANAGPASGAASSAAPAVADDKRAPAPGDGKKGPPQNVVVATSTEPRKKSVPPGKTSSLPRGTGATQETKKTGVPSGGAAPSEAKKTSVPPSGSAGNIKKKSEPPPAPPAPVIRSAQPSGGASPRAESDKAAYVPPNAWGARPAGAPQSPPATHTPATPPVAQPRATAPAAPPPPRQHPPAPAPMGLLLRRQRPPRRRRPSRTPPTPFLPSRAGRSTIPIWRPGSGGQP